MKRIEDIRKWIKVCEATGIGVPDHIQDLDAYARLLEAHLFTAKDAFEREKKRADGLALYADSARERHLADIDRIRALEARCTHLGEDVHRLIERAEKAESSANELEQNKRIVETVDRLIGPESAKLTEAVLIAVGRAEKAEAERDSLRAQRDTAVETIRRLASERDAMATQVHDMGLLKRERDSLRAEVTALGKVVEAARAVALGRKQNHPAFMDALDGNDQALMAYDKAAQEKP